MTRRAGLDELRLRCAALLGQILRLRSAAALLHVGQINRDRDLFFFYMYATCTI